MVSKEDFEEVWKDSSRESILNQFYYEHKILQEEYNNWNELKEWLEDKAEKNMNFVVYRSFFNAVKHKIQELESRKQ